MSIQEQYDEAQTRVIEIKDKLNSCSDEAEKLRLNLDLVRWESSFSQAAIELSRIAQGL